MNGSIKLKPGSARGIGNNRGFVALLGSCRTQGENGRPGVPQEKGRERPGNQTQTNHDDGKANNSRGKLEGIIAMIKSFCGLFRKKQEDSMERRAEESRRKKNEEIDDIYNKTHRNLDVDLDSVID